MNTSLRAIGTPQELERSVSGKKTVIGLEQQANDAVLGALKKLSLKNLSSDGDTITFDVEDPDKENSPVIEAIVLAGGHVRSINTVGSTLEETYLKLVRK
jgi:hypothetical protein